MGRFWRPSHSASWCPLMAVQAPLAVLGCLAGAGYWACRRVVRGVRSAGLLFLSLDFGQVARTQAPLRRPRPRPGRLRRFTAAVRRLSQALFLACPR